MQKRTAWINWMAMGVCLCLVFIGLVANSIIKSQTVQVKTMPSGILAKVTEILDNGHCEVVVTGKDDNFNDGAILTIYYNSVFENSQKVDKQLELGDIIAVTYDNYEEKDSTYNIAVEYVSLFESTE